ncbi:carboxylesterase family protein [Vibrio sp. Isolate33]|uniref:carboxylesterase family protein n=1 Tax=Vibrio sp. Isolate33 TaxID=2908539 RepID=UPI001EFDA2A1|nr:carboxylesterase family protein [Vibrio sp. Isolate33]MCG9542360.1 carboxylesterase family protein [Vibrio sp. Isolate33]
MTIAYRSMIALTITAALAGCDTDTAPTVPLPNEPEPLMPAPAKSFDAQIGDVTIKATIEELVISSNTDDDKLASVESFKGIQYAEAQRFEHSNMLPLSDNTDEFEVIDATQFGYACPQNKSTNFGSGLELEQSEDCLNLNIWRPEGTTEQDEWPVYVFIHGGDFEYGTGSNPMIHGDTVVAQGADEGNEFIAITFNYRLGLLGSRWKKGTEGIDSEGNFNDGNYGIGDQKSLLEWVQKNIGDFGGNADKVTIMGQGAGAMSIEILQHKMTLGQMDDSLFERAIMQSAPTGFEYQSYSAAKSRYDLMGLGNLPTDKENQEELQQITDRQSDITNPISKIEKWLLRNAGGLVNHLIPEEPEQEVGDDTELPELPEGVLDYLLEHSLFILNADKTPMAELMPFAPYLECYETKLLGSCKDGKGVSQPAMSSYQVPTVTGVNSGDSNTIAMLPSLTFLIPTILKNWPSSELYMNEKDSANEMLKSLLSSFANDSTKQQMQNELNDALESRIQSQDEDIELNLTAYNAVSQLFLGLGNFDQNTKTLGLTDYYVNDELELGNAIENMSQFKTMLNDLLFTGPARMKVSKQSLASTNNINTFYYFDYKPGFNIWTFEWTAEDRDILGLIRSISCISGSCNGSELPFVFNKALKMDGSGTHPGSKDKQMMNEMSRAWFNGTLFSEENKYVESEDKVLVINKDGISLSDLDWDQTTNEGQDPKLRNGRLNGLENLELMAHYLQN